MLVHRSHRRTRPRTLVSRIQLSAILWLGLHSTVQDLGQVHRSSSLTSVMTCIDSNGKGSSEFHLSGRHVRCIPSRFELFVHSATVPRARGSRHSHRRHAFHIPAIKKPQSALHPCSEPQQTVSAARPSIVSPPRIAQCRQIQRSVRPSVRQTER